MATSIMKQDIGEIKSTNLTESQFLVIYGYGWVSMDGKNVVGSKYHTITGETTVPDLRGRTPICAGHGSGLSDRVLGASGGTETHTLITTEMPTHNHGIIDPGHAHSIDKLVNGTGNTGTNILETPDTPTTSFSTGSTTTGITIQSSGGDVAHNNMQPFKVINYFIKIN